MLEVIGMGVYYYETPVYGVAKHLIEKGYKTADYLGVPVREPDKRAIGILKPRPPVVKRYLFFRRKMVEQRALFLGVLWFTSRGADPEKLWILHVYGRENVQEMTELAEELRKGFSVDIHVILDSERTKLEPAKVDIADLIR